MPFRCQKCSAVYPVMGLAIGRLCSMPFRGQKCSAVCPAMGSAIGIGNCWSSGVCCFLDSDPCLFSETERSLVASSDFAVLPFVVG